MILEYIKNVSMMLTEYIEDVANVASLFALVIKLIAFVGALCSLYFLLKALGYHARLKLECFEYYLGLAIIPAVITVAISLAIPLTYMYLTVVNPTTKTITLTNIIIIITAVPTIIFLAIRDMLKNKKELEKNNEKC
jgi:hypothetical protein